jgi:thiol-disulfide isomerase/thioredoxin
VRRRVLLAAAPWSAAGLILAGCTGRQQAPSSGGGSPPSDPRMGTVETFLAAQRRPGPAVTGQLLDGSPFDLAGWRGQIVVINFWGSWCAPYRAEAPELEATFQATKKLGVRFLGVDVRDDRDAATAFHHAFGLSYPSLYDPAGQVAVGFRDVSPNVVPSTLLLDRQLRVAAVFRRRVTSRELTAAVRALAGEQGG